MEATEVSGIEPVLEEFRRRRVVCICNESQQAWLATPAEEMDAKGINEIISITGGLLFVVLSAERAERLGLVATRPENVGPSMNPYLKGLGSVEAKEGVTTGISASDRARTIAALGAPDPRREAIVRPGHIFPLLAPEEKFPDCTPEGVALALVRKAGFSDAAVIVRMLGEDGMPVATSRLAATLKKHDIRPLRLKDVSAELCDGL